MDTDALADPLAWVNAQAEVDPVRRRVLEGLARRASVQTGALRERLVAKLVLRSHAAQAAEPPQRLTPAPCPLAALVAQLQTASPELRSVATHRRTWSALRVQRRMAEVAAPVPEHLGPLNSQVLVTRALQQLQGLVPGYLQRLLTQLDTLAALAPLQSAAEADKPARPAAKAATRPAANKAAPRRR